jgi:hypothetical protein
MHTTTRAASLSTKKLPFFAAVIVEGGNLRITLLTPDIGAITEVTLLNTRYKHIRLSSFNYTTKMSLRYANSCFLFHAYLLTPGVARQREWRNLGCNSKRSSGWAIPEELPAESWQENRGNGDSAYVNVFPIFGSEPDMVTLRNSATNSHILLRAWSIFVPSCRQIMLCRRETAHCYHTELLPTDKTGALASSSHRWAGSQTQTGNDGCQRNEMGNKTHAFWAPFAA